MRFMRNNRVYLRQFSSGRRLAFVSLLFFISALLCIPFADLALYQSAPAAELLRMLKGLLSPYWYDMPGLANALGSTVAFALLAVAAAALLGLGFAFIFQYRVVRLFAASTRAVHEIFWGLIFMQIYGLSATTGLLAILIPYVGIFTKVYAEILQQQSRIPANTLAPTTGLVSRYLYTLLPQALPQLLSYTRYRFECALRSSAILGFIGLPTLGFHLETAFKQGDYSEAAALLLVFYVLIASIKYWLKPKLIPLYLVFAVYLLPASPAMGGSYFWQFISQDIWPQAVLQGEWLNALHWYQKQFIQLALPGIGQTLLLTQLALVLTALITLLCYPFGSRLLSGKKIRFIGAGFLLVMRSTPEMMLAFILLLVFGPSGLPAVIALAVHNGGLIAYLVARYSELLHLSPDAPRGINRYFYNITPRIYPQFLALLFYRWEVILRESAIMGILGISTLGFYIDSAFEDMRFDKAFFLILITALLNILVDMLSRRIRRYCQLQEQQPC
jgi:phosphonate transport system permease protein